MYRWRCPPPTQPLKDLLDALAGSRVDAVCYQRRSSPNLFGSPRRSRGRVRGPRRPAGRTRDRHRSTGLLAGALSYGITPVFRGSARLNWGRWFGARVGVEPPLIVARAAPVGFVGVLLTGACSLLTHRRGSSLTAPPGSVYKTRLKNLSERPNSQRRNDGSQNSNGKPFLTRRQNTGAIGIASPGHGGRGRFVPWRTSARRLRFCRHVLATEIVCVLRLYMLR